MVTIVEQTDLEGASIMLEACRASLASGGFVEQASALVGMQLLTPDSARTALGILKNFRTPVQGNKDAEDLCRYTIATLESVLAGRVQAAS